MYACNGLCSSLTDAQVTTLTKVSSSHETMGSCLIEKSEKFKVVNSTLTIQLIDSQKNQMQQAQRDDFS